MKLFNKLIALLKKLLKIVLVPLKMIAKPLKKLFKMMSSMMGINVLICVSVIAVLTIVYFRMNREQFTTLSQAAPLNPINNKSESAKF